MDRELLEQLQLLVKMVERLPTQEQVQELIDRRARQTEVLLENDVSRRIDSLFDGYQMAMEKQYELERRVARLEEAV
ncbi:MAG TPA: hypothetical protein H9736_07325 [Candidatus Anaerotruncus excrementipullorum]|uniref:Uncharacterized protein n=1 Tax=Candidatus Anaerotruncus excrementipullorum TaxID=2838465 RepID=A0A9D1WSM0_9FIRM|nr:hypothetical protein [Candidatus Anaerotruncus excrementipullorum]